MLILTIGGSTRPKTQLDAHQLYLRHSIGLLRGAIRDNALHSFTMRIGSALDSAYLRCLDYEFFREDHQMSKSSKRPEVSFAKSPKPDSTAKQTILDYAKRTEVLLSWYEDMVVAGYRVGCSWSKDQGCYVAFATGVAPGENQSKSLTMRGKSVASSLGSLRWAHEDYYGRGPWSMERDDQDIV